MPNLNDKLILIKQARDDIQSALIEQGQEVGKDIRDYAEAVSNIEGGAGDVEDFPIYATWLQKAKYIYGEGLPYTELEYIESTGIQYIDTGVSTTANTKVEMTYQMNNTSVNYPRLFGWYNHYDFEVYINNTNVTATLFKVGDTKERGYDIDAREQFQTFSMNSYGEVIYNNTRVLTPLSSHSNNSLIEIFRGNDRYGAYKLKEFKIYEGATLLRDFIPVKRKSDDEICLYDTVSETFYTNQGSGNFIAGPEKPVVLPYTELEYIESTGTQWIDTGIEPTVDTKSVIDFQFTGGNTLGTVLGVREKWTNRGYWVGVDQDRLGNKYWQQIGSSYTLTNTYSDTNRHTINFSRTGLYLDDTLISTINPSSFVAYANLPLFKCIDGNNTNYMCQKLYSFDIYENNVPVRTFIPVKRKSDNEICLYDKISGEFFTNQGTGVFTAGPEVTPSPVPSDYTLLNYIQTQGSQYINTGYKPNSNTVVEVKVVDATAPTTGFWQYWFGMWDNNWNSKAFAMGFDDSSLYRGYNNAGGSLSPYTDFIGTHRIRFGQGEIYCDDVLKETITGQGSFTLTNNLYIFAQNRNGSATFAGSGVKIGEFIISENNTELYHYYPVIQNSTNKVGYYEKINDTFTAGNGTGNFIGGEK